MDPRSTASSATAAAIPALGRRHANAGSLATSVALQGFVVLGAVLLFMLEPMTGRQLSVEFGAGVHVWNTCMMFYSGALVVGYLYAHWVAPRIGRGHLVLIAAALLWMAMEPRTAGYAGGPVLEVLWALLYRAAIPFVALSTTSIVAQQWLARRTDPSAEDPYHLYAASNTGSLLALIAYPLAIEPLFGIEAQRLLWNGLLVAYAGLAFLLVQPAAPMQYEAPAARRTTTPRMLAYWFALSASPAIALLAVTNLIVNELGSIPLAWVAPLAVYLCTFMLAFRGRCASGSRWRRYRAEIVALACIALTGKLAPPLLLLFWVALSAHAELHRVRPPAAELTTYYLVIGLGGWAGLAFVSLAAPLWFTDLIEWPLALVVLSGALLVRKRVSREPDPPADARRLRLLRAVTFACTAGTLLNFAARTLLEGPDAIALRNYYGVYRIAEKPVGLVSVPSSPRAETRYLVHGGTVHGVQLMGHDGGRHPLGYYHPASPVGEVMRSLPNGPLRVAAIGLGAGSVAAYFGADDTVAFYELDADGESIARTYFHYLRDSAASLRFVVGDARFSLARDAQAPDGYYDLIFVDAFSGDSIPAHLLTREALQGYLKKLRRDGLLLFHVSSRFYDFDPILRAAGEELGLHGAYGRSTAPLAPFESPTRAYLLSRNAQRVAALLGGDWRSDQSVESATLWTDDYQNALAPLFWRLRERVSSRAPDPG